MAAAVTKKSSYPLTFAVLVFLNVLTIAAVYAALMKNDDTGGLLAVTLLAVVVVAQTVRCGHSLPVLTWASTIPLAIAMAYTIGAHPALDWSGPGEADQMDLAPIYPVVIVVYAIGFAILASMIRLSVSALRRRHRRGASSAG